MSQIPTNLNYTKDHEWTQRTGNKARIGITDFAQNSLGDIVFVELPEVGRTLSIGDSFGVVESIKSVSDLYSPHSGTVVARNEEIVASPEKINETPYESWLIEIEVSEGSASEELLNADQYKAICE